MEKDKTLQDLLNKLEKSNPEVIHYSVEYNGSGDSFNEFWSLSPNGLKMTKELEDVLFYALDNSAADFNNDGSEGTIEIDLNMRRVTVDNNWLEMTSYPSGIITLE